MNRDYLQLNKEKMKLERDILICTVGTSLLTNIEKDEKLKKLKIKGNWIGLTKALLELSCKDKICGAEINSITSLIEKEYLHRRNELYLLISDTDSGKDTGEILKCYYESSSNPYRFERVLIKCIEGLKDTDFKSFRNKGLKNLLINIAKIAKEKGSQRIIINATGGYKAQISFAGLIGQALSIPVMYMFETFPEIITLPPQPFSFNYDLWLTYYKELELLTREELINSESLNLSKDETMATLIEKEKIEDTEYISLSPVGLLFHESFKQRFQKEKQSLLPIELPENKRKLRLSEHFYHFPPLFAEEKIKKIFREKRYIKSIRDIYINPDLPKRNSFEIDSEEKSIIFTLSDGKRTVKFLIELSQSSETFLKSALIDLSETYLEE